MRVKSLNKYLLKTYSFRQPKQNITIEKKMVPRVPGKKKTFRERENYVQKGFLIIFLRAYYCQALCKLNALHRFTHLILI